MVSMCELTLKDDLLQIAQRRRHARDALAELDEVILYELLAETDLEQPRLKVPHIPPVKRDFADTEATEKAVQLVGHELVADGPPRAELQETPRTPQIVGHPISARPLGEALGRKPKRRENPPFVVLPPYQHERGQIAR